MGSPRLLLCDEPTGNLDSVNTATVRFAGQTAFDVFVAGVELPAVFDNGAANRTRYVINFSAGL